MAAAARLVRRMDGLPTLHGLTVLPASPRATSAASPPSLLRPSTAPALLTPRQAELLSYCVQRGYYAIPRRATLRRLGADLGISPASLSLALRRAEARLIAAHIQHLAEESLQRPATLRG